MSLIPEIGWGDTPPDFFLQVEVLSKGKVTAAGAVHHWDGSAWWHHFAGCTIRTVPAGSTRSFK